VQNGSGADADPFSAVSTDVHLAPSLGMGVSVTPFPSYFFVTYRATNLPLPLLKYPLRILSEAAHVRLVP